MAEDLQALLDKINEDGLKKTDAEREKILQEAREESARMISEAEAQAKKIVEKAGHEAELLEKKAEQAVQQAVRDMLLGLRAQLEKRVAGAVQNLLQKKMNQADWGTLLTAVCASYLKENGREENLEVLVPAKDLEAIRAVVAEALAADLKEHCELAPSASLGKGFKVLIKGTDVMYDFSDEALMEAIAEFVSPGIASVITAKEQ